MASGNIGTLTDLFAEKSYTYVYSVTASGGAAIAADNFTDADDNPVSTPTGYVPFAIKRATSGSKHVALGAVNAMALGTTAIMTVRETNGSAGNDLTARLNIVYVKSGFGIT